MSLLFLFRWLFFFLHQQLSIRDMFHPNRIDHAHLAKRLIQTGLSSLNRSKTASQSPGRLQKGGTINNRLNSYRKDFSMRFRLNGLFCCLFSAAEWQVNGCFIHHCQIHSTCHSLAAEQPTTCSIQLEENEFNWILTSSQGPLLVLSTLYAYLHESPASM